MADELLSKKTPSTASRYLFVLIFGLVLGIIAPAAKALVRL